MSLRQRKIIAWIIAILVVALAWICRPVKGQDEPVGSIAYNIKFTQPDGSPIGPLTEESRFTIRIPNGTPVPTLMCDLYAPSGMQVRDVVRQLRNMLASERDDHLPWLQIQVVNDTTLKVWSTERQFNLEAFWAKRLDMPVTIYTP